MARKYNYIYSQLVEDNADIVGHIAYALYKEDKIEFISKFKKAHGDTEPSEDDLQPFNDISSSVGSIEKYKFMASCILQAFIDNTLEDTKQDVEDNMNRNHIALIQKALDPIKPISTARSYLHGIAQSVIGAFVFMLLLCVLVFALNFSNTQYTFTFGEKGDATLQQIDKPVHSDATTIVK